MTDVDPSAQTLKPARLLADSPRRFPGESAEYRRARNDLLAEEIELRRHIERVAAQRRALPPGGVVPQDYRFEGEAGAVTLSEMFGAHDTLVTYNWMFGPQRARPCPMCTSLLSAYDGEMPDILQRVAFAVIGRSPIDKLVAFKKARGWRHLRLYSSATIILHSTCSRVQAASCGISGPTRWGRRPRTQVRIRAAHPM
jgi:predicted dithiol-disulfide oxidoreductase (DUF899 family)